MERPLADVDMIMGMVRLHRLLGEVVAHLHPDEARALAAELLAAARRLNPQEALHVVTKCVLDTCDSRQEALNVLMHVTAAIFAEDKTPPDEVVGYLVKITKMLDGEFDR